MLHAAAALALSGTRSRDGSGSETSQARLQRLCLWTLENFQLEPQTGPFHLEMDGQWLLHRFIGQQGLLPRQEPSTRREVGLGSGGPSTGEAFLLARPARSPLDRRKAQTPWATTGRHLRALRSGGRDGRPHVGLMAVYA